MRAFASPAQALVDTSLAQRCLAALRWLMGVLGPWRWIVVPLGIVLAARIVVFAVGYAGELLIPDNPGFAQIFRSAVYTAHPFLGRWYAWDASWYATIALNGYQATGPEAASVAFWPLLPLLQGAVGRLTVLFAPHLTLAEALAWAGLAVVLAAFALSAALLYRVVYEEDGPDVARRTVTFLAFAPGAVFLVAGYPEALLLAGVAGCIWALRHERWLIAGLAGGLASLAQVPGCFLALSFAWEYLRRRRGRVGLSSLWVLLIPLGPAVWLTYLWTLTGNPLTPISAARTYWPHRFAWPWETLVASGQAILGAAVWDPQDLLNLAATFGALGAAVWALRTGYASWGLWSLAALALYLSVPAGEPLESMVRYVMPLLPLWLALARAARHPLAEAAIIAMLAMLLSLTTVLYVNGYWLA